MIACEVQFNGLTHYSIDSLPEILLIYKPEVFKSLTARIDDLNADSMRTSVIGNGDGVYYKLQTYDVNRDKFATFIQTYGNFLYSNWIANPNLFGKGYEVTLLAMKVGILQNKFGKDTDSFKQTCKALGIKNTYKAIDAYLERK
jgi:hypothetical protein